MTTLSDARRLLPGEVQIEGLREQADQLRALMVKQGATSRAAIRGLDRLDRECAALRRLLARQSDSADMAAWVRVHVRYHPGITRKEMRDALLDEFPSQGRNSVPSPSHLHPAIKKAERDGDIFGKKILGGGRELHYYATRKGPAGGGSPLVDLEDFD